MMQKKKAGTQASEKEAGGQALLDPQARPAKRWAASAVALRREEAGMDGPQEKDAATGRVAGEFGKRVAAGFVAQGAWKGLLWLWEHWG